MAPNQDQVWLWLWCVAFANLATRSRIGEPTDELYDRFAQESERIADAGSMRCGAIDRLQGDKW